MDPLSITASIVAVLQLTSEVIKYLTNIKNAPRECQQCVIEASNLQNLLISLRYRLEQEQTDHSWFTAVRALGEENGPLDQYKQALEQLQSKLDVVNGASKIKRQLAWRFSNAEVAVILGKMERLKSLVNIALEMDHFKLSQAIKDKVDTLGNVFPALQTSIIAIGDTQNLQQHHAIIEWLSPTDFPAQQHDIISRKQEGTGQWFLDSPEFNGWLQGAGSQRTLFCPGMPGAGKTMIAAIAIDHLCRTTQYDDIGIAYLFCNYKTQANQSALNLLSALLKQLVQSRPDVAVSSPVTHIYDHHSKRRSRPSLDEIFGALQSVCSSYASVYIVVDALDECADKDGERSRLVNKFRDLLVRTDVRLMFTSRFIPEIVQEFQTNLTLEVRASEEDVRLFVEGQISRLPKCIERNDELKHTVQTKIANAVDGMFLLARLHIDSLGDKRTKQQVLSTLERLSKGSAALEQAYGEAIKRIDGQLDGDRLLARRALCWITCAQRMLTTTELCYALAIEPGDKALNNDNVYEVDDVVSVCAGLVTVDAESNIIRLVHYTTQEYFERIHLDWHPSAQEEIAVACLTYLSFDTFQSGSCADDESFQRRLTENVFLDYSARYWSEHTRLVEKSTSILALAFLCDKALVDCTIQTMSTPKYKYKGYSRTFPNQTNGLHLTARHGLLYLTERLLGDSNIGADLKDSYGRTPLSWATEYGHEAVVKLLLETGKVDVDSKDSDGRTPLSWAAGNGHEAITKQLLETGKVDIDSKDSEYGRTPLSWAAEYGYRGVVKQLLQTGKVDVDLKDSEYGRTPLSWAAGNGHDEVVKQLLETNKIDIDPRSKDNRTLLSLAAVVKKVIETCKVNVDSKSKNGRTPLSWAAENGHVAVVKLLIETGKVDVDSKDSEYGRTPLSWASGNGHEAVTKQLLETGKVDVDSKDSYGRTPLSWAAEDGHEVVVNQLLETNKVDVDSKSRNGQTPLSWAAENGHEVVVKQLLETDKVDVDLKDSSYGRTPLSWAAGNGHEAVIKLLLETGKVDVESKSKNGRTPLSWVAGNGHEAVVKQLLETGKVDVDSKDSSYGRTPLSWAAENGHWAIVKQLLETGRVDVDSKDSADGRTPLSWAAGNGHEAVVKQLLETGKVDVDSKDSSYGRTPLSWAAEYGHEGVVKQLLETGKVDVDLKDSAYGRTPLSWAAEFGHEEIVKLLLETGKVTVDSVDSEYGQTPLSIAAENGHEAVVRLLLETCKVDVDWKDFEYRRTPLSWAAENGHEAVIKQLLETGKVDVESKDSEYGQTPLSFAAGHGYDEVVTLLLKTSKPDVETKGKDGQTPLLLAAEFGHKKVLKILLETGKADVNCKSKDGRTPLSWAAENGYEEVVELLLEIGKVHVDSKSKSGRTPLSWAAELGHEKVVKLLLETGKVDVDSKDSSDGQTPLSWAAEEGHEGVVKLLLETGKGGCGLKE